MTHSHKSQAKKATRPQHIDLSDVVIEFITHNFGNFAIATQNMSHQQVGIFMRLMTLYFGNATAHNGKINASDFELLAWQADCHSDGEIADLQLLLKAKFKKVGKSYRHADWDKQIKNIMNEIRKNRERELTKESAKSSNASNVTGGSSNVRNDDSNAPCNVNGNVTPTYDVTHYVMTGAERTEKSRKLKSLRNKGVQADSSMSLDEIRTLFDTHFYTDDTNLVTPTDDDSNAPCNASNAQKPSNSNNLLINNSQVKSESNARTHEKNFSFQEKQETNTQTGSNMANDQAHQSTHQSVKIQDWKIPELNLINQILSQSGLQIDQTTLDNHAIKFKNYYENLEFQGKIMYTENSRLDKLIDWLKREKDLMNPNHSQSEQRECDPYSMVYLDGEFYPCFEGYSPTQCSKIIDDYRMIGESSLETYQRIVRVGLANCPKHEKASPEFVKNLLSRPKTNKPTTGARA